MMDAVAAPSVGSCGTSVVETDSMVSCDVTIVKNNII